MKPIEEVNQIGGSRLFPKKRMSVTYFGGNYTLSSASKPKNITQPPSTHQTLSLGSNKKEGKTRCRSNLSFQQREIKPGQFILNSEMIIQQEAATKINQKQFPVSLPSHSFFYKSKPSLPNSLKATLQPRRSRASNPVIVRSPLQGVLKAKSTQIRKNKLQQYYINFQGERETCLVFKQTGPNVSMFQQNHQIKRKIKKKVEGRSVVRNLDSSHLNLDYQGAKTKTLESLSCPEPLDNLPEPKRKTKYLFAEKPMDDHAKNSVSQFYILSEVDSNKILIDRSKSFIASISQSSNLKQSHKNSKEIENNFKDCLNNSIFLKERVNSKRGHTFKRAKQTQQNILYAISEDFDLKPWGHPKIEDKENDMAF